MYCNHCGVLVPEGARFCTSCGARLTNITAQSYQPRPRIRSQKIFVSSDSVFYGLGEVEVDRKSGGEKFAGQSWTKEATRKAPGIGRFVAENFALTFDLAENFGVDYDKLKLVVQSVVILVFASVYHALNKNLPKFTVQECEKNFQGIFSGSINSDRLIEDTKNFCPIWTGVLDNYLQFERSIQHPGFAKRVRATTFCMIKALVDQLYDTI